MNHKKIAKLVQILKAYLKLELHCSKTRQIMSIKNDKYIVSRL